jgi:hypothetical protein
MRLMSNGELEHHEDLADAGSTCALQRRAFEHGRGPEGRQHHGGIDRREDRADHARYRPNIDSKQRGMRQ